MSGTTNTNTNINSNSIGISNNSSSSNNNNNVSEDPTLFKYYIEKCYVLPLELKNDIIYCQRALRDFLKVHRLVSDVFREQSDADPVQMRRILEELQTEVHEINAEQQYLMLRLDEDLDAFYKKLEDNNIRTVPELGNAYVSSLIVPLISDVSYKVYPQSVLTRDTEDLLIRKHFLIFQDDGDGADIEPIKLSDLDDNVPLVLVDPPTPNYSASNSNQQPLPPSTLDINIIKDEEQLIMPPPPPRPMPPPMPTLKHHLAHKKVQNQYARMLPKWVDNKLPPLKPIGKLVQNPPPLPPLPPPLVMIPRHTPATVGRPRGPRLDAGKQPALKSISTALSKPPQLAPLSNVAAAAAPFAPKLPPGTILTKVSNKLPVTKVPSKPPLPLPLPPAPPAMDLKKVANSRMTLNQVMQRARKTKQQPRKDDNDAIEVISPQKVTTPKTSKTKAGKASLEAASAAAPTATNKKTAPAAASTKPYKTRNAQGTGRKTMIPIPPPPPPPPPPRPPPQPPVSASQQQQSATAALAALSLGPPDSKDTLHQELELQLEQQRLCASAAEWRDEPRETRVLPYEYGRENFLGLFGLYTHDVVKKLCQRHSKRKRRTVQNASGVDYHYGQQLSVIDAVRQKKLKDKPGFLLSPKVKRLQAKKAHKAAAAAANRKSKSITPEKLADPPAAAVNTQPEVGKQKCKECKKRASDHFRTCKSCHGHYHIECHEDDKAKMQTALSGRCPPCLRDLQLSSTSSSSSSGGGRGARCVSN